MRYSLLREENETTPLMSESNDGAYLLPLHTEPHFINTTTGRMFQLVFLLYSSQFFEPPNHLNFLKVM